MMTARLFTSIMGFLILMGSVEFVGCAAGYPDDQRSAIYGFFLLLGWIIRSAMP